MYTWEASFPKTSPQAIHLREGNYITFLNRQNVRVLGTIMTVDETSRYKKVYMEDTSLNLINKIVLEQTLPSTSQPIEYYIDNALKDTGWKIGKNESNTNKQIEYKNNETLLQRIKNICDDFGVEFYFETDIETPGAPDFYLHIVKQRLEGDEGFRLSSDDFVEGITRRVNIDNIVTKLVVEGKEETDKSTSSSTDKEIIYVTPYEQNRAKLFDSSKAKGATAVSTTNWNLAEVNKFRMNQADPPHVTGAYIDNFLRNYYSDSPLIGQGQKIKDYADYYGIAVGAVLGVWAKETTFGRAHPGKVDYNYGCIRWTSGYQSVTYAGSKWRKYPTQEAGIADWFHLVRYNYVETGQANYEAFLNKYSPTFENNQATFKNIMWGVLKAFGYNTSDTVTKRNFSKSSDNPLTIKINNTPYKVEASKVESSTTPQKSAHDKMIDKLIKWFKDREGKVTYSMNSRGGPNSYDCSSAVYSALFYAGFKPNINYLGSTVSLWNDIGTNKLMYAIDRSEARRGDIFLSGARGAASAGASGHTGVFIDNNTIIHCSYAKNGIATTGMSYSGSPLYCFRLVNRNSKPTTVSGGSTGISSKTEKAVQRALSQVGGRYVWGGTAFKANDCSGLIYEAYRYAGFTINHRCTTSTIQAQKSPFKRISASEARRGDLAITMGGGHVEILLQEPSKGISVVHSASPELGIIKQNRHSGSLVGYYRVMDV